MPARAFETKIRVIYGDTDQMGVVYYANYFRYFEAGRTEFFRSCGGTYLEMEKSGYALPVVEAHCEYKSSAKFDDVVVVRTWVDELKRASLRFGYSARRESDDAIFCKGYTWHACIERGGKPARLPEAVVRLLTA